MGKKKVKVFMILLFLTTMIGLLLVLSLFSIPFIVDRANPPEPYQIIFLIGSSIILVVGLCVVLIFLNVERRKLKRDPLTNHSLSAATKEIKKDVVPEANKKEENEIKEQEDKTRFFKLTEIDQKAVNQGELNFEDDITLSELCEEFRNYSANSLRLYYDISDIRRFIGGLAVSHIMILQGMSGTGKTSLAYAFGGYLQNPTVVVPIQPMWKERTDLIGYYNEFTKKFNETTLLEKLYEASLNEKMYITVLDEMNIARVEYYFAEFLSLLELPNHNDRHLEVVADVWETDPAFMTGGKLNLPNNMWFVGTANNDDSTFSISDKVYDRAMVINLDKKAKIFQGKAVKGRSLSATRFQAMITEAQKRYEISNRNLRRIAQLDAYLMTHFHITFGNRIMMQIRNYVPVIVACGGSELSALDDIMSKKVLRKLETKNMVYVKNAAPGLISFMDELFGEGQMALCKEYIQNIEINA